MSRVHFVQVFDKLPAHNAQNEFKLLLNGREMKLAPCFLSAIIVYAILTFDLRSTDLCHSSFSLLIAYQ